MGSSTVVYGADLFVESPAALTMLALIYDRVLVYDRFLLYDLYRREYAEPRGDTRAARAYRDDMIRREQIEAAIRSTHSGGDVTPRLSAYVNWLERHRPLFRENIVQFAKLSGSAVSLSLVEYQRRALAAQGLAGPDGRRTDSALDAYYRIDTFYWSLATAAAHGASFLTTAELDLPVPARREDVVDARYDAIRGLRSAANKSPDRVVPRLAAALGTAALAPFPALFPYDICRLREALAPERAGVRDALAQLTIVVASLINAGVAHDEAEACAVAVTTLVLPRYRDMVRAAASVGGSRFRRRLVDLVEPVTLLIKALDPTEIISKWDVIAAGAKMVLAPDPDPAASASDPVTACARFVMTMTDTARALRPMPLYE